MNQNSQLALCKDPQLKILQKCGLSFMSMERFSYELIQNRLRNSSICSKKIMTDYSYIENCSSKSL